MIRQKQKDSRKRKRSRRRKHKRKLRKLRNPSLKSLKKKIKLKSLKRR
jgi:hypothetical protein